ncbi:hypothetical protein DBR27_19770 [Flavobacterium sp. HMWF030]|nr:hypothetical protein DBR27_19770 [Flavobacterium sp. HMWF030]
MDNSINKSIVLAIKQCVPEGTIIVHILMDLLSLGKESVYRRLRGEIGFTLEEIIKIANRFGISIDDIIESGRVTNKWVVLNLDKLFSYENYIKQYCERLNEYLAIFKDMQLAKRSHLSSAGHIIPATFLFPYKKLSQFRHYKWHYFMKGAKPNFVFSNMVLPDEIIKAEENLLQEWRKVPMATIIVDEDIFSSMIKDIQFFASQQLVTQNELLQLKKELLDLLSSVEMLTETGCYETGSSVMIYLCKIKIDNCYYHMEYDDEELCFQRTFYMDLVSFNNTKFCKKQREWIDLLKRFSLLLTQSGDRQRLDFFEKQRQLIKSFA